MDCDMAKAEDQCVKDVMDEILKNICDQPASNCDSKNQEKEESEAPLDSKLMSEQMDPHLTSEGDKVSLKVSSGCKYRDVLNSLFDPDDENIGPAVDYHELSERCKNMDYIPLSCPVKGSNDGILSEENKSFHLFLDDMQSLTMDEKSCAMAEKYPEFHVCSANQLLREPTKNVQVSEQTSVSKMLTIQALVNSQESEHFSSADMKDHGENLWDHETKVLPVPIGSARGSSANTVQMHSLSMTGNGSSFDEELSLGNYIKHFITSRREDEEDEEFDSSLNLDKFVENLPGFTDSICVDSDQSQHLFLKENLTVSCLDQFVNKQLQNVYGDTDGKLSKKTINAPKQIYIHKNAETTGVTPECSTTRTSSSPSFKQDSPNLIECDDMDSQVLFDQTVNPLVFNKPHEKNANQTGNDCPRGKACETIDVDKRDSSGKLHNESISSSDNGLDCYVTDSRLLSQNDTSERKLEHLLVSQESVEQDQVDSEKCGYEIIYMNKNVGHMGSTKTEHVFQKAEITKEKKNHSDKLSAVSNFKEAYADIENGSDQEHVLPEHQHFGQVKTSQREQEYITNIPNDIVAIAKVQNTLNRENFDVTENIKCTVQKESCLKHKWSHQVVEPEIQHQGGIQGMYEDVTQSSQHQSISPQLLANVEASELVTQKQMDSQLQQSVIMQQTVHVTQINHDDNSAGYKSLLCPPSSYPVALHDEELDKEKGSSEQWLHLQGKTVLSVSDKQVSEKDRLVPDQTVALQKIDDILSEKEASLYTSEDGKLKEARLPSPTFKWKYRPSCDEEDEDLIPPVEEMASVLGNIQPLITGQCNRSLRVGLSRKQKVKRLHKNVR